MMMMMMMMYQCRKIVIYCSGSKDLLLYAASHTILFFYFFCLSLVLDSVPIWQAGIHFLVRSWITTALNNDLVLWICRWLNGDAYTFCSFPHNSPVWQPEPNHTQCLLTSGTFLEEKWNYFEGFTFINLVIYRTMWNMRHLHRRRQRPGVSSVEHWNLFLTSVISVIFGRRCSLPTVDINVKCALYT